MSEKPGKAVFDKRKIGMNTDGNAGDEEMAATAHVGFWFAEKDVSSDTFSEFAHKVYLRIENPHELWYVRDLADEIAAYGGAEAYVEAMREQGYDGIIIERDLEFATKSYVVFDSNQIKSATENVGTFNPGNPDIRFSVGGVDENLIVVHNVSEQKLLDAIRLGALPVPSIGIIDAEKSNFTDYGAITLVGDRDLIDPKRPKNKVFNSDIYSARRPEIQRMYSDDDYDRALEVIAPYEQHEPDSRESIQKIVQYHRDDMVSSDFEDDLKNSDAVRNWYPDTREGDEKFEDWWLRVAAPKLQLSQDGRIFDGFTNSGRRRYLPANLETIVKLMTRKVKDSERFFYGVGNIRANLAKQFKSIAEIQKNRDKIIPGEEYNALKKEASDEYYALLDDIEHAITGDRVARSRETAEDLLRAMAEGVNKPGNREWLVEALGQQNPIYQQMADFLVKLRDLPPPLFEAKPQRAVYLDEFKAAVVPAETSNSS